MRKILLLVFTLLSIMTYSQYVGNISIKYLQHKTYISDISNIDYNKIDTNRLKENLIKDGLYEKFQNGENIDILKYVNESKIQMDSAVKIKIPQPIVTVELLGPELPQSKLTYVINDTMMVGETYTIDVTLSTFMTDNQLIKIIDGFKDKNLIDTMINITPMMRVRLLDPSKCFKQEPITSEIQNTTNKNLIRWQWQVIPTVEGNISLTISVDNYIDGIPQNVNIYNGKTYVYAIHTWYGDIWIWVSKYWDKITYIIGGLLTIFGWLYKEKIINILKKK